MPQSSVSVAGRAFARLWVLTALFLIHGPLGLASETAESQDLSGQIRQAK